MKLNTDILKIVKATSFLLTLFGVWYCVVFFSEKYIDFEKDTGTEKNVSEESMVEVESLAVEKIDMVSDVLIEDLQPEEVFSSAEVLAVSDDADQPACESVSNSLVATPVYINGSGEVDYKDGKPHGTYVSKNSEIKVTRIRVPAFLLAGSTQTIDSNEQISTENAVLKSAGDGIVDYDAGRQLLSPVTALEYDQVVGEGYSLKDEAFQGEGGMSFAENTGSDTESETEYNVDGEKANSVCEYCKSSSYNPEGSHLETSYINDTMSIPGGETEAPQNEEEYLTVESGDVVVLPDSEVACQVSTSAWEVVTGAISNSLFNKCNLEDEEGNLLYPDECIRVEDIVIRTNSFFGNYERCNEDGECMNTYMSRRTLTALSPVSASKFEGDFLVEIPNCEVAVNGERFNVPCLWDVSYIYLEYYFQHMENSPEEEFPSWEEYKEAILQDYEERYGKDFNL